MKRYVTSLINFGVFFAIVVALLIAIDLYIWDKRDNPQLNKAINEKALSETLFIGSSKFFYHHVDSILSSNGSYSYLSLGGQYNYASVSVLKILAKNDLIKDNIIFLDLQDNDELETGFLKWWYFAESFITDRTASFLDYPIGKWPRIAGRIIVDVTDFRPNSASDFDWIPFEKARGRSERNVHEQDLTDFIINYNRDDAKQSFSLEYIRSVTRLKEYSREIEERFGCKIFFVISPGTTKGSLRELQQLLGDEKIINLTNYIIDMDLYHDDYHLNAEGSVIFTEKMLQITNQIKSEEGVIY